VETLGNDIILFIPSSSDFVSLIQISVKVCSDGVHIHYLSDYIIIIFLLMPPLRKSQELLNHIEIVKLQKLILLINQAVVLK
jgi:hypothetical protein